MDELRRCRRQPSPKRLLRYPGYLFLLVTQATTPAWSGRLRCFQDDGSNEEMGRNVPIGPRNIWGEKDDRFASKYTVDDSLEWFIHTY